MRSRPPATTVTTSTAPPWSRRLGRRKALLTEASKTLLLWSPRVLGILVSLFLGVFALDAFSEGKSFLRALPDFAMHLLPSLLLLAIVGVSWRWEWVGGIAFTGVAVAYAYGARGHPSWVLLISGPLLVVGILFWWSWRHHGELRLAS